MTEKVGISNHYRWLAGKDFYPRIVKTGQIACVTTLCAVALSK